MHDDCRVGLSPALADGPALGGEKLMKRTENLLSAYRELGELEWAAAAASGMAGALSTLGGGTQPASGSPAGHIVQIWAIPRDTRNGTNDTRERKSTRISRRAKARWGQQPTRPATALTSDAVSPVGGARRAAGEEGRAHGALQRLVPLAPEGQHPSPYHHWEEGGREDPALLAAKKMSTREEHTPRGGKF